MIFIVLLDEKLARVILKEPELSVVFILANDRSIDARSLVLLNDLVNLVLLFDDLLVKPQNFIFKTSLLSLQVRDIGMVDPSLSSGGIQKLFMELIDLFVQVFLLFLVDVGIEISDSLNFLLLNFLDLGMDVILLLEQRTIVFKTLVEELAEAVEVVDHVNEVHKKINLLFVRKLPLVLLRSHCSNFVEAFSDVWIKSL
jgi:hypothetical protein